jgi:hypothetical protein
MQAPPQQSSAVRQDEEALEQGAHFPLVHFRFEQQSLSVAHGRPTL